MLMSFMLIKKKCIKRWCWKIRSCCEKNNIGSYIRYKITFFKELQIFLFADSEWLLNMGMYCSSLCRGKVSFHLSLSFNKPCSSGAFFGFFYSDYTVVSVLLRSESYGKIKEKNSIDAFSQVWHCIIL